MNNGRINITGPNEPIQQSLYTDYKDALCGLKESTLLSQAFFSKENIQLLQDGIRIRVNKLSNGTICISPQDENSLKMYMRQFFLEYGKTMHQNITQQIEFINTKIIEECSRVVFSEAKAYIQYKKDVSTLNVPHNLPRASREFQQLELRNIWF